MTTPPPGSQHDLPSPEALRLLVLVARHGSLSRAAVELGITQPSASKRLSALERRLQLVLVDRTRRGSTLTAQGQAVAGWSDRVLAEFDALMSGARALRAEEGAELGVAASLTLAEYLVPGWIGRLRAELPELYVGLQVTNSARVAEAVRAGEVTLGFIESPSVPAGLSSRQVATDRLVVVVAPGHPWARRGRPLTPSGLATTALVLREPGSGTRQTLDRALLRHGLERARPLLELGSTTALRSAVVAGAGPGVISELAVSGDLSAGRLAVVGVSDLPLRRALRAVWPAGHRLTGPAARLVAIAGTRS